MFLLLAAALCAYAAGYFSGQELSSAYRENAREVLAGAARTFEGSTPTELRSPANLQRSLAQVRRQNPDLSGAIVLTNGAGAPRVIAKDGPTQPSRPGLRRARRATATGTPAVAEQKAGDSHLLVRTEPLGPRAALWLSFDLGPADAKVASRDRRIFAVLAVLLLCFTAFTAWVLTRSIFRPLNLLRMATQRIAEGSLGTRMHWSRRDELGALAHDFDLMAAELEEGHGRLESLARRDPLTGLANHREFQEALHSEISRARADGTQLALIVLDIDRFKRINDAWGHPAGDKVLAQAGITLPVAVQGAGLVARLGGDEFGVLLPGCDAQRALASSEAARTAVKASYSAGLEVTCSAGVAVFPDDAASAESLIQVADGALYWAKREGRDTSRLYDPEHVLVVTAEQRAEFVDLIETPNAITPVFQPIVDLSDGRVIAYEALARFAQSERRRPPSWWFAQAHRFGLGPRLEARAIREALAVPRPPGAALSVNVSLTTLYSPELNEVLPERLDDLILEITEQEEIEDLDELQALLEPLRERGARVAVDDAGAGYSGLQQIMKIRADLIKLDRALVSGVNLDHAKVALIGSLVDYANSTGAEVCAEGIETLDELRVLASLGVCCGQGYVLARPAAAWPEVEPEAAALCRSMARTEDGSQARPSPGAAPRRRSHLSSVRQGA